MHTPQLAENPGLQDFDISQYQGIQNQNFFEKDKLFQTICDRYTQSYSDAHKNDTIHHLSGFGALCGGELNDLVSESHKEGKYGEIIQYDHTGNRIDKIEYCYEQREVRRLAYEYGIVNLDYHKDWQHDFTSFHKMGLAYIANQNGESGYTCPLAMTDGMIQVLRALGSEDQKNKYLPLIAGENSDSHFMCGQYVTERVGGSNVAQNRTVARPAGGEKWILTGEKWFCSNPGDLWVTTAKIENTNTIGMFLVSRIKDNGELNGCYLLRKKDIIGSRGKVTAEAVYENLEAELLGRSTHGLANLLKYVIQASRIHVSISALGMSRRAYVEARQYVGVREAYGKKVIQFPTVKRQLAEMQILHSVLSVTIFKNYELIENKLLASGLLTPLLKFVSTVHSTWLTHEAIMLHGGNGILGDFSPLPRLHNDAIINETWEGTHHIICEHVWKAFRRKKIRDDFFAQIQNNLSSVHDSAGSLKEWCQQQIKIVEDLHNKSSDWLDVNLHKACEKMYQLFALSEMLSYVKGKEDVYHLMAMGYQEIVERGVMGPTTDDGVFSDLSKWDAVIDL